MAGYRGEVQSHSMQYFDFLQFSTKDFYAKAKAAIVRRNIPKARIEEITLSEGGIFSSKRLYLRVIREQFHFDICAAPFGTGFFVSWRLGEKEGGTNIITRATKKRETYYRQDSAAMFKACVQTAINEAIDEIVAQQGERMPQEQA